MVLSYFNNKPISGTEGKPLVLETIKQKPELLKIHFLFSHGMDGSADECGGLGSDTVGTTVDLDTPDRRTRHES